MFRVCSDAWIFPPQITQYVGRCGPVAGAVDSAENIVCFNMVEPLVRIRSNFFFFYIVWRAKKPFSSHAAIRGTQA